MLDYKKISVPSTYILVFPQIHVHRLQISRAFGGKSGMSIKGIDFIVFKRIGIYVEMYYINRVVNDYR